MADSFQDLAAKYGATVRPVPDTAPETADIQALAAKYGATVKPLSSANDQLDNPNNIYMGMSNGVPVYKAPPGPPPAPIPPELQSDEQQRLTADRWRNPRTGMTAPWLEPGKQGAPWPLNLTEAPQVGAGMMGEGIERIAGADTRAKGEVSDTARNVTGGLSTTIRGGLEAASPLIPGALWKAPVATALTLGAGTALSTGGEAGAKALGIAPEHAALFGDLVGLMGAGWTLSKLRTLAKLPYTRQAEAINSRLQQAMEAAKTAPTELDRQAARVQIDALMRGLEEAEAGPPMAGFLPQLSFRDFLPENPYGHLKVPSTLNPIEQQAVDYARTEGNIRLSPGTITGNRFLQSQEALTQNRPFGATAGAEFRRGTEADLQTDAARLTNLAHPMPAIPESAGRRLQGKLAQDTDASAQALLARVHAAEVTPESVGRRIPTELDSIISELGEERDSYYADAWRARNDPKHTFSVPVREEQVAVLDENGKPTGETQSRPVMKNVNMPVDVRDIQALAEPIVEEMQWMPKPERDASAGYTALMKILKGDGFIPAWAAEKGLSGLKEMARLKRGEAVRNEGQGIAAYIIPALQERIDAAVGRTGAQALEGLRKGRETHAQLMDVDEVAKELRGKEPVQNFERLKWGRDTGIDYLRKVEALVPGQMAPLGRAVLAEALAKGRQHWDGLGPETQKILVPDEKLRAEISRHFDVADVVKQLKENKPVNNFDRLTAPKDTNIDFLKDVAQLAPEMMPELGRAWVQRQMTRAIREGGFAKTTGLLNDWRDLGDKTKAILFPNAELRSSLGNLFKVADMASHAPNPSGTALVAGSDSWNPLKILTGYIGSKALFTPKGIALLTESVKARNPLESAVAEARIRSITGKGPEGPPQGGPGAPPPEPPPGAGPAK